MMLKRTAILVAALNWGLGHATRVMPIINYLRQKGFQVIIASDGRALQLLQKEYPQLITVELPAYDISYNGINGSFVRTMAKQIPKILHGIYTEHQVLKTIVKKYAIKAIISDNRYGCFHATVPSAFISHQLFMQLPPSIKYLENILWRMNRYFISHFNHCWVPDYAHATNNLSGILAHKKTFTAIPVQFLGPLSRFQKIAISKQNIQINTDEQTSITLTQSYTILAVISGPEPQRSIFEQLVLKQVLNTQKSTLIVRGITEKQAYVQHNAHVASINYLTSKHLAILLKNSQHIISRAGYSTVMDLVALGKTAILVPTPQQTEQEYLGQRLRQKKYFYSVAQQQFNLQEAIQALPAYKAPQMQAAQIATEIDKCLKQWQLVE
jgi:uncharacterized protein (TIGR00661 family)